MAEEKNQLVESLKTESVISELNEFDSSSLKVVECKEKVTLPSAEDIAQEKEQQNLLEKIAHFSLSKLKHVETEEKIVLPTKEDIENEKEN